MQPIYQGKPPESQNWLEIPAEFVPDCKKLGYELRELVLRDEAELAKVEHFNAAIDRAAQMVKDELGMVPAAAMVAKLQAMKLEQAKVAA